MSCSFELKGSFTGLVIMNFPIAWWNDYVSGTCGI